MLPRLKFFLILAFTISNLYISASTEILQQNGQPRKIVILTIPKCGSSLIGKAVAMITKRTDFKRPDPGIPIDEHDMTIWKQHLLTEFDYIKNDHSNKYIKIIQIRDLRDMIISQIYWMDKTKQWWLPLETIEELNKWKFDERLEFIIKLPDVHHSARWYARLALEWMRQPDVFVSRFEDLVGVNGGGDRQLQEKTLRELAAHLECNLTDQEISDIADNLFGGTQTFRKGHIGGYKNYFDDRHKMLFKQTMGRELIELGYERDYNW